MWQAAVEGATLADVVISYRKPRREAVGYLADVIEGHGYSVWWDKYLRAGQDFEPQIREEFAQARAVIVLWCSLSVRSDSRWVPSEGAMAARKGTLVPACIENIDIDDLPLDFQRQHRIELFRWDGKTNSRWLQPLLLELSRLTSKSATPNAAMLQRLDKEREARKLTGLASFPLDADGLPQSAQSEGELTASVKPDEKTKGISQKTEIGNGSNNTVIQVAGNYRPAE